jgi:nucleoside phosphorylase
MIPQIPRLHEDFEISCKVLAKLILRKNEHHEQVLLLSDFLSKSKQIRPNLRNQLALEIMSAFVALDVKNRLEDFDFSAEETNPRPRADVAIITVIQEELIAAKIAFGIDLERKENRIENGLRFWETTAMNESSQEDLKVVLTMIGKAGNVECAVACSRLFQTYEVGLCVLVGIAAGLKTKVNFGDVVSAELVLDYEGARLEPEGAKKRPTAYPLQKAIERDMNYFNPRFRGWHEEFARGMEKLKEVESTPEFPENWKPKYYRGVILAGEKLLADGSLPHMQAEYHDRVRAAEMEGSGFASICDEYAIPWLVFRGISDFGDPDKPKSEVWRTTSVLAAASAARAFIKSDYRKQAMKF